MRVPTKEEMGKMRDASRFLERKGYGFIEDFNSRCLAYENGDTRISIYFPIMENESQIDIRFLKESDGCPLRWVIFMATGRKVKTGSGVDDVIEMLKYLKDNYLSVTNHSYCQRISAEVDEYVSTHFIQH